MKLESTLFVKKFFQDNKSRIVKYRFLFKKIFFFFIFSSFRGWSGLLSRLQIFLQVENEYKADFFEVRSHKKYAQSYSSFIIFYVFLRGVYLYYYIFLWKFLKFD